MLTASAPDGGATGTAGTVSVLASAGPAGASDNAVTAPLEGPEQSLLDDALGDPNAQRAHSFAGRTGSPTAGLLSSVMALRNGIVSSLSFGSVTARDSRPASPHEGPALTGTPAAPSTSALDREMFAAVLLPPECEPSLSLVDIQTPSASAEISLSGGKPASQEKLLMRKSLAMTVASAAATAAAHTLGAAPPSAASMGQLLAPSPTPPRPHDQPTQLAPLGRRSLGRSQSVGTPGLSLRPTPPPAPIAATGTTISASSTIGGGVTPGSPSIAWSRPNSATWAAAHTGGQLPPARPWSSTHLLLAAIQPQSSGADAASPPEGSPAAAVGVGVGVGVGVALFPDLLAGAGPPQGGASPEPGVAGSPRGAGASAGGGAAPTKRQAQGGVSSSTRPWQQQQQQRALGATASFALQRLPEDGVLLSAGAADGPSPAPAAVLSPLDCGPAAAQVLPHPPSWQRLSLSGAPSPQHRPASAHHTPGAVPAPPSAVIAAVVAAATAAAQGTASTRRGPLPSIRPLSPSSSPHLPGGEGMSGPGPEGRGHGDGDVDAAAADGEVDDGFIDEVDDDEEEEEEGSKLQVHIPAAPEVRVLAPRWLNLSAFQVTEQLRSGRLQELADHLAAISCPTLLDLCGLEFSGSVSPPDTGAAGGRTGWLPGGPFRHTTLRFGASGPEYGFGGGGGAPRYKRGGPIRAGVEQVLRVPPGQHVTLCNGTLLLTAEQYLLVGRKSSLMLKGVEILGCSRAAAVVTAVVRRRIYGAGGAAAAPSPAGAVPALQAPATSPAPAIAMARAMPPTPPQQQSLTPGAAQAPRRVSLSGVPAAEEGAHAPSRRVSDAAGVGFGVGVGVGLQPIRERTVSNTGGATPSPQPPPPIQVPGAVRMQALVDKDEYVEDHGLVEVVGGHVRISRCRIWPGRCQLALCVSEGGRCTLSHGAAGPVCAAGAKSILVCQHVTVDGGAAGCTSVLHGARAALTGCRLRLPDKHDNDPAAAAAAAGGHGGGDAASGGGDGELGLEARGEGSVAVLSDCELTRCGIGAHGGAYVHMHAVRLSYARHHGLFACDPGTALFGADVRIEDSGAGGVVAADGATLRLAGGTIVGSGGAGVAVLQQAAVLPEWQVKCGIAPAAAQPPPRGSVALVRCSVSANAGHGAAVTDSGVLELKDTELYNNLRCGVAAEGRGAALAADGVRVIRNEAYGVRVAGGAGAVMARCVARGNGRDGLAVEGRGTRARLRRCESRQNRESGLCVTDGATVELLRCRLSANQHDGLSVGGAGSLAAGAGCTLGGNVAKGAVVCMGGRAELTGCSLHCNGSKSAQVADEGSRLVLGPGCSLDRTPVALSGGVLTRREEPPEAPSAPGEHERGREGPGSGKRERGREVGKRTAATSNQGPAGERGERGREVRKHAVAARG